MLLSRRFGRLLPRLWHRRNFCKATEPKDSDAKRSQQLWDILVPERNWDFRSPFIPTMILAIAVLQYMISLKKVDVAERELEESKHLLEEKRARRAAQEAALEEKVA
ncbi:unnamed protein product [Cladocopium goreaui]|uniref:Uncharacterized protein n=1 Tax=Cladocopium goreaui TaxID=2562237 RepID=A0A9P1D6K9_9DINO|nr:unnamed protein product [Cladocopium goreaui]|mmetsp:Transcript_33683/g.72669  ORF Transcript_33683/g.72669 Transcript_33683/m.72669 type:complete len:107 (-) Transcript_33683:149-469(-)